MTLADLLMERFKVRTRGVENPLAVTSLGVTPLLILGNNPNRLGFVIINLSDNAVFVSLTNEVASTRGIRLSPNGGQMIGVWDEDFQLVGWAWWAVAGGAGSAIYVVEIVGY